MKKKHFRRIISLMLVLVMLAGMVPLSAVQAGAQEDTGGSSQEENGSDGYTYVERTWDAENSKIVESVEPLPYESFCYQGQDQLSSGVWYYIENTYTKIGRIRVVGHPKLILLDGSSLNSTEGIEIDPNSSLTIYGDEKGTGVLKAELDDKDYYAAIGGSKGKDAGKLIVKGGRVTASSSSDAPAIGVGGGDYFHFTGTVEVYGGKLIAKAGEYGSGIGAGYYGDMNGTVNIYGGIVETTGGKYGTGIGGGEGGSLNGTVNIYGGHVTVMGGKYASGIGGGQEWRGKGGHLNGAVNIYGGNVTTIGGYGGAGIGGGEDGHGGTVNISGGKVAAEGGDNAAGIGGEKKGTEYSYSAKEYADYLLDHPEIEEFAAAADLVKKMLNYGAYAQIYFSDEPLSEEELANYGLSDGDKALGEVSITPPETSLNLPAGVTLEGMTLSLKSQTSLSLYFKSENNQPLTFSCGDMTVVKDETGGYQIARIRDIPAKCLKDSFTLTVTAGANSGSAKYSPMNYCSGVLQKAVEKPTESNPKLVNVVKALYNYSQAANRYFK